jgi:hypothetical protein
MARLAQLFQRNNVAPRDLAEKETIARLRHPA